MDGKQLEYFANRLSEFKHVMEERMGNVESTLNVAQEDSISELSMYDNHPADVASETFERSKDLALWGDARLVLGAIDDALDKIDQGRYGYCDHCGAEINMERLEAIPYTTMCMACKAGEEIRDKTGSRRPLEEEVFPRPWRYANDDDSVGYDREDIWQDLAQHGLSTEIEEVEDEDRGEVQDIEAIPFEKDDGFYFESTKVKGSQ
ncbi:MAG: TraR/DksA C4-type zinc finger protein [Clostridia bacterium]|nr:TraR/DksA C4-type zinc finger protein [Clostridia bacterium]MDQ7792537.1 TraR/DksA C4-type zinc finger protein [Clostridia bacterium]